jgi:hypothetical protein
VLHRFGALPRHMRHYRLARRSDWRHDAEMKNITIDLHSPGLRLALLLHGKDLDIIPALHWPLPQLTANIMSDDGPVLIQIEYIVDGAKSKDFEFAIEELKNVRLRDGAINWGVFHNIANPDRYVETFMAESWAEHLRYHERFTNIDREIEDHVLSFHIGKAAPLVNHFIGLS